MSGNYPKISVGVYVCAYVVYWCVCVLCVGVHIPMCVGVYALCVPTCVYVLYVCICR